MATGWHEIEGNWYYFSANGEKMVNAWMGDYWLGEDGIMVTNAWVDSGRSYVDANGRYQTGWLEYDDNWYYLGMNGVLRKGWINDGNAWYYCDKMDGKIHEREWIDGKYFLTDSGAMATGWHKIEGDWYYFNANGEKMVNTWVGDYWLGEDGIMVTNAWVDSGKSYVDASGRYLTGWLEDDGNWYYFDCNGRVVKNSWINDTWNWYYLDENGFFLTDWQFINGKWYYFETTGAMHTGWVFWENNWYLLLESGEMATSNAWYNGRYWYINSSGIWIDTSINSKNLDNASSSAGVTSFGGYTPSASVMNYLKNSVNALRSNGYEIGFIMLDMHTGKGIACNPDVYMHSRSTIKGINVASLSSARPDLILNLEDTMRRTVQYSNNDTYKYLYDTYGPSYVAGWCRTANVRTEISEKRYPDISPRELAKLWTINYDFFAGDKNGAYVARWYEAPNQSVINAQLGTKYITRSKAGWYPQPYNNTHDAGIVYTPQGPYVVAIMTNIPHDFTKLKDVMWAIESAHQEMVSDL